VTTNYTTQICAL